MAVQKAYLYQAQKKGSPFVEFLVFSDGTMEFTLMPKDMTPDLMNSLMESCSNGINRIQKHGFSQITLTSY